MQTWLAETTTALCDTAQGDTSRHMIQNRDIVCLSSLDWDAHWTSKQQIMHRLAEHNRVLYVEEPVTMLAPFIVRRSLEALEGGVAAASPGRRQPVDAYPSTFASFRQQAAAGQPRQPGDPLPLSPLGHEEAGLL